MTSTSVSENLVVDIDDDDGQVETVSTGHKRKGKTRAPVWDHYIKFTPDKSTPEVVRVMCKYCKDPKGYKYDPSKIGTSTLKSHLTRCKLYPENVKRIKSETIESYVHTSSGGADGASMQYDLGQKLKFNQESVQEAVYEMLVVDELPFMFVEHVGFIKLMKVACPLFKMPSRFTAARGCVNLYTREKGKLKSYFKKSKQRISITTDGWTSNQTLCYLVVTAHFVDEDWQIRKVILNFVVCPNHKGDDVGLIIEECLKGWEIDNVFSITVDNAAANDKTVSYLKRKFVNKGTAILGGKHMHVRCVAHIINLIVKHGMDKHDVSINRVRKLVRYIKHSPARVLKLKECAGKENIDTEKFLTLDCPTRWNSLCDLLERAVFFKSAFERYKDEDVSVRVDFSDDESANSYPNDYDWGVASFKVGILENFRAATTRVSGVSWKTSGDSRLKALAINMKDTFDNYWGVNSKKSNLICYFASLLDPRYKFFVVSRMLKRMFGEKYGDEVANSAMAALKELFEEYQQTDPSLSMSSNSSNADSMITEPNSTLMQPNMSFFHAIIEEAGSMEVESELEKYPSDPRIKLQDYTTFRILDWWADHKKDYPILSRVARDIFAIPISTVASESAFSTSGRVIKDFRSSLKPATVEALICAQDWIRRGGRILTAQEEFDLIQKIEEELKISDGDTESAA